MLLFSLLLLILLYIFSIHDHVDPTSTPHRPYINSTSTLHRPYIDPWYGTIVLLAKKKKTKQTKTNKSKQTNETKESMPFNFFYSVNKFLFLTMMFLSLYQSDPP